MTDQAALQTIDRAKAEQWEKLDLSGMELTELPPEIAQLTNLQSLSLRFNQISAIPESIAQLTNLESLDLSHNG